jgi:hypothetical protein
MARNPSDPQPNKARRPPQPAAKPRRTRTSRVEKYRNDSTDQSPLVLNAARVLDKAMDVRGLSPAGMNEALKAIYGFSQDKETIRQKRTGQIPMSLVNMEEYARALDIPWRLFTEPVSELLRHFANEAAELEAGRDGTISRGPDQGLRKSTWKTRTPACDPKIEGDPSPVLASIGT